MEHHTGSRGAEDNRDIGTEFHKPGQDALSLRSGLQGESKTEGSTPATLKRV